MSRLLLCCFALIASLFSVVPGSARADSAPPPLGPDDIVMGNAKAPITIIEYASMSCPHCAEFEVETWPLLKKNWLDTGKAKYAFRDFPLNGPAFRGSLLAHCAPRSEFYPFIEVLYSNQPAWVLDDEDATMAALQRLAALGGISADRFKACEADKTMQQKIAKSETDGQSAGVDSTPTFFINGTKLPGALPYEELNKAILAAPAAQ